MATRRSTIISLTLYLMLAVECVLFPGFVGVIPAGAQPYAAALLGPPALLVWGISAFPVFAAATTLVLTPLLLSWIAWHRYPHSEIFAVGILAAVLFWLASGWLSWFSAI